MIDETFLGHLVPIILVILLIVGIVYAIKTGFKGGGNLTTIYGATAEMYTKDKKAAMETIVEQKAKKKMEEQESGETLNPPINSTKNDHKKRKNV